MSGLEYAVTFDESGTFDYYCLVHPWMIGQIIVKGSETYDMTDDSNGKLEEIQMIPASYAGTFVGVGDGIHDAQGSAYTIPLEDGTEVLRLENFKSTNGPDLYVYLSTNDNASDFVSLGMLKASSGNQNYEIPTNTDLSKYDKVLIWCKAFGVLFGSADLSSS
ncbi:DM13 domain-containing protein [archaeon]|nr:DM13 domain-containing protein [archaeon]